MSVMPAIPYRSASDIIRGGIYYIRKHHSEGCEQQSGRPAVVISDVVNTDYNTIVTIVYLTSKSRTPTHVHIPMTSSGIPAIALCEQVTTVDVRRIGNYYGLCTPEEMTAIKKGVSKHLGMISGSYFYEEGDYMVQIYQQQKARIHALEKELNIQSELARTLRAELSQNNDNAVPQTDSDDTAMKQQCE